MSIDAFGHLAPELASRFRARLNSDQVAWLTLVTERGTPQPAPVWFLWDEVRQRATIYSQPSAKRLDHIDRGGKASLHLNDDGQGHHYVVMTGAVERLDPHENPPADRFAAYLAKYRTTMEAVFGTPEEYAAAFSVPLSFVPRTVRGN